MSENVIKSPIDDNILIKSYENSTALKKEELAQRIALATNSGRRECDDNPSHGDADDNLMEPDSGEFKVGDYARATYDDGIDYEATILAIDDEQGTCLLRYIGYNNEQEVRLSELIPSWGKKSRRMQYTRAKQAEVQSEEAGTSTAAVGPSTTNSKQTQRPDSVSSGVGAQKRKKSKKTADQPTGGGHPFGSGFTFPAMPQHLPQPPLPPMMLRGSNDDDAEHLAAMLMSWYISGYYTGLYQGMQKAKGQQKTKNKSKK